MKYEIADDIKEMCEDLLEYLFDEFSYIKNSRIFYVRSFGSKANCYARIWSMPKIWQLVLEINAFYVIEICSEHFDKQSKEKQKKILVHELMHIPKNFSGALTPHKTKYKKINDREIEKIYKIYKQRKDNILF